jgi:hypothetical protein
VERSELQELHFITPIENLPSIINHGIVCHRRSHALGAVSIALEAVQNKRAQKRVPSGLTVHDYANLYFNARNPMLSARRHLNETICVLSVNANVIDLPGVVISDQNAGSNYVRFSAAPHGLAIVDSALTFAENWKHPEDQIQEWRHSSAMCAEVLVPDAVPPDFVDRAYVCSDSARQRVVELGLEIDVVVRKGLFF